MRKLKLRKEKQPALTNFIGNNKIPVRITNCLYGILLTIIDVGKGGEKLKKNK